MNPKGSCESNIRNSMKDLQRCEKSNDRYIDKKEHVDYIILRYLDNCLNI